MQTIGTLTQLETVVVCNEMNNYSEWKIGRTQEKSNAWKGGLPKCKVCGKQLSRYNAIYCKEHKGLAYTGDKHPKWKGNNVGYGALHGWVYKELGKATKCKECGSTENVQWANKSHEYKRDIKDWVQLCSKCHLQYDGYKRWENHIKPVCFCGEPARARGMCIKHYTADYRKRKKGI